MGPVRLAVLAAATAVGLVGCQPGQQPAPPVTDPVPAAPAEAGTVRAQLGDVPLVLEVADTAEERAIGLMGRQEVPPGTGMIFRYDEPVNARFYMYRVPVPLTAVFVLQGRVVDTVLMPPCPAADPQACPRYGPASPFDTVVETAPETSAGVNVGDTLMVLE